MEIVLLQDLRGVGFAGDVLRVKRGFAINYLLPQGYATPASAEAYAVSQQLKADRQRKHQELVANADQTRDELDKEPLVILRRVSPEGTLYGGVNENDIVHELAEQKNMHIQKSHLSIPHGHLRTLGMHTVDLHLAEGVHISIKVDLQPENPEDITVDLEQFAMKPELTEKTESDDLSTAEDSLKDL